MNVALLGPTCAGKTTQSALLTDAFELVHVSPGLLLREHRSRKTALGILSRRYIEKGEPVPDEVVSAIIEEAVCHTPASQGLLFDGFPMSQYQAEYLDDLLSQYGRKLDAVIYLPIPPATVFERAAKRIPARDDDKPEILGHRLKVFERNTGPVLKRYAEAGCLAVLRAKAPVDRVYQELAPLVSEIAEGRMPVLAKRDGRMLANLWMEPVVPQVGAAKPALNLIILGGPSSGKGTHASFLGQTLGIPHISTGDLFRANISQQTPLGKIAQSYINRGQLVPDDITEGMVRERLSAADADHGFLLDGFPRTMPQVHALDEILAESSRKVDGVIYLNVPDEEIVCRSSGRRICPTCKASYHIAYKKPQKEGICDKDGTALIQRDDDTADTIRARLKAFHAQTAPLVDHFTKRNLLVEVSGVGSVDQTRQSMLSAAQRWQQQTAAV